MLLSILLLSLNACNDPSEDSQKGLSNQERASCDSLLLKAEQNAGSNISMAKIYAEKARTLFDSDNNEELLGRYHMAMGRIYYYEDRYLESISHYDSAIPALEILENPKYLAKTYAFSGATHFLMGNTARAIDYNLKSISINEENGDDVRLAGGYIAIGNIYMEQKDYDLAMNYFEKAFEISKRDSLGIQNANVLSSKGEIYLFQGDLEKAEYFLMKSYDIRVKCANIRHIALALCQLAELRFHQKNYNAALEYLVEAEQIYNELDEKTGLFIVYNTSANIYTEKNDLEKALENATKAYELGDVINSTFQYSKAAKSLYEIFSKSGEYKNALNYFNQYHEMRTELVSLEKNRLIANLEYNYELEKKTRDNENLKQKNQIRKQQVIILSIFAFLLIVLVVVLYVLSRLRSKNFRNEQILLEKKKEMAEAKSELSEKEKIILENNLEIKNKELTSKTVELLHQIETMQSLAVRIESLKDSDSKSEIEEILHELKMKTRENVWDEFHTAFNSVHEGFYNKLLEYCPDLSSTEIKIAALLKLNLSTKEIAAISYKSESAVKTARHRLRNKLKLSPGEDLITFLMRI